LFGQSHDAKGPLMTERHDEMRIAIHACMGCYQTCLGAAMTHCLEKGGEHAAPAHLRLMLACAEACRTAGHLMLLDDPHHARFCAECAAICEDCARDCERLGGMQPVVEACRHCAAQCRKMAA
jgi:hypothetical protein